MPDRPRPRPRTADRLSLPLVGGIAWCALALLKAVGAGGVTSGLDLLLLLGLLVAVPLALRLAGDVPRQHRRRRQLHWVPPAAAGALVALAFTVPAGLLAIALASPWTAALLVASVGCTAAIRARLGSLTTVLVAAAAAYAVATVAWVIISRGGGHPGGFSSALVELTAVHFAFAGTCATTLALCASRASTGRMRNASTFSGMLVAGGSPLVAIGFATGSIVLQLGAAVLIAGVVVLGVATAFCVARVGPWLARGFLGVSVFSIPLPMALAAVDSFRTVGPSGTLPLGTMIAIHGTINALGLCLCGLVGWTLHEKELPRELPSTVNTP